MSDASDLLSGTATATVSVSAVNDAPAAGALSVSTAEDTALSFTAAQFDVVFSDADAGDSLQAVRVVSLPAGAHGELELNGSAVTANQVIARADLGTLTFTPARNFAGNATFGFQVSDASDLLSGTATATVTVTAVNDAPAAGALNVTTAEDTALTFTAAQFDVVFSDVDTGDSLTAVRVVTLPPAAAGVLKLDGSAVTVNRLIARADLAKLSFTPVTNWNGRETFTFTVADQSAAESEAGKATVTVTAANDAPAAGALSVTTAEDTALSFAAAQFDVVFGDVDAGDSLQAVRVVSLPAVAHGKLALNGNAVTANQLIARADLAKLSFTPVEDWNGTTTFTFKVTDQSGAESGEATATLTVSAVADAPAAGPLSVGTAEDTALSFTAAQFDVVFSDADTGDSLKAVKVVSLPSAEHGKLALNGNAVTANDLIARGSLGTLSFTPLEDWIGTATFTFKVTDQSGAESGEATATVTVTAVNDAPTAGALSVSTAEDTALSFTAARFDVVFSDVDAGDSLQAVRVVSLPSAEHGKLELGGTAVTANDLVARGSLGTLSFTPEGDWNGQASFTFKVTDQSGAESGEATATVTVSAVNDAPAAGALNVSTAEDTALSFTAAQFDVVFSDVDAGDSLQAVRVVSLPSAEHGKLELGGTAVTANDLIARGSLGTLSFTPVGDWNGQASFTFKVTDQSGAESGEATATVTVTAVNDAPTAGALSVSMAEDAALSFTAAQFDGVFGDVDEGDSLKAVRVVSLPSAEHGKLELGGTAVTANDLVARGSLGTLSFTPEGDWNGQASFTFKVTDQSGAESGEATATVTVSAVNDAPAAGALNVSTAEDTALSFTAAQFDGVFGDGDAGDSLQAVRVVSLPSAEHGKLELGGTAVTANDLIARGSLGTLSFTPLEDWNGTTTFTFKVTDQSGAESGEATATVTVSAVNDAPTAGALNVSTAEDTALSFTAAQFDVVFGDADAGDSLKAVRVVSLPGAEHGKLELGGTAVTANQVIARGSLGTLSFTPVGDWNGTATFTFKVTDQSGAESGEMRPRR